MNYEKKYREALERARNLLATSVAYDRFTIEKIFPELRESEDEKTRKEIIYHIQNCDDTIDEETEKRMLAWLEKQDKETSWKPSKEEMDVLYGLAYITNQYDEYKEEVITRLYQDLKREFFNGSSYENMFPNTEDGVRRRSTIQVLEYAKSLDTYNQYGKADIDKNIAWLEKQGERNHKIQPKFKIGDIIRFKGNETLKGEVEAHKIVGYDNELYVFADGTTDLFCEQDLYELVEQKSADKVKPKFHEEELKKIHVIDEGKAEMDYCFTKMMNGEKVSPAWSEEDERLFSEIMLRCKKYGHQEQIDWLKSLKQRIGG